MIVFSNLKPKTLKLPIKKTFNEKLGLGYFNKLYKSRKI